MARRLAALATAAAAALLVAAPADAAPTATVTADYNGDGYGDVAAGAPGEDNFRGAVNVVYGSAGGLTSAGAQQISQSDAGGLPERIDEFGRAVASGDFNGDGYGDLVIGAPSEDNYAGVVNVVYGSAAGVTPTGATQLSQATAGGASESDDRFGRALATGDFNSDGFADLAVGAAGEDIAGAQDIGYVTIFYGSASGLGASYRNFSQNTAGGHSVQGNRFGEALASGYFNDDSREDLAIGTPFATSRDQVNAGVVNVLYGTPSGLSSIGAKELDQSFMSGQTEVNDQFGSTLATGLFNGDSRTDIAVGTPGEGNAVGSGVGVVNVAYGSATGLIGTGSKQLDQAAAGGTPEQNDEFGFALAAGDFDGDGRSDLAIDTPQESDPYGSMGVVNVMRGSATGLTSTGALQLTQAFASGGPEQGDEFGFALGTGDYNGDGRADLAASAPFEGLVGASMTGAFNVMYGSAKGIVGTGSKQFSQSAAGGTYENGDFVGWSLR